MLYGLNDPRSLLILRRIRGFSILAATCVLVLLALIGHRDHESQVREAVDRTHEQASALAGQTGRILDIMNISLALLADQIADRWRAGEPPGAAQRTILTHSVRAMPHVRAIAVIGADGRIIVDTAGNGSIVQGILAEGDAVGRDFLRVPLRQGGLRVFIGAPVTGRGADGLLIPVSRPVAQTGGAPAAVVVAFVGTDFFRQAYDSVNEAWPVKAALVSHDGRVLAASSRMLDSAEETVGEPLVRRIPLTEVRSSGGTTLSGDLFPDTAEDILSLARVDGWPLVLLAAVDKAEATGDGWPMLVLLFAVGALVIIGTTMFELLVSRQIAHIDATGGDLRSRIAELEISQGQLEQQGAQMVELAEQLYQAREEAERARQAADLANHAKSEFLARMSHELRTPLNAILGFSEIMRDRIAGLDNFDTYCQYAGDIHESGSHLLSLINDILDLSKVEAGRFEFAEERLDLRYIALSATRLVRETATRRGLTVAVEVPATIPLVLSDERVVKQMLLNLLSNALKFTPRGGSVTVSAGLREGWLAVVVRDTGMGIDRKDFAKVLEPFGQVLDMRAPLDARGTGLGLPLVKSFIEAQGGRFELDSEVGIGTVITLWFPPDRLIDAVPEPALKRAVG